MNVATESEGAARRAGCGLEARRLLQRGPREPVAAPLLRVREVEGPAGLVEGARRVPRQHVEV